MLNLDVANRYGLAWIYTNSGEFVIEFRGVYYPKGQSKPQSVLVQFDGVVLHVWHMADPFHRLLTSDVFRLSNHIATRKRHIKLPNGGRIETDDFNALNNLKIDNQSTAGICGKNLSHYQAYVIGGALMILAAAILVSHYITSS